MEINPQVVGGIYVFSAIVLLTLLQVPIRRWEVPGSRPFAVMIVAVSVWSAGLGIDKYLGDPTLSTWLFNVVLLATETVALALFFLALEFSGRSISRRFLAVSVGFVGVMQAVIWTDGIHGLFYQSVTLADGVVVAPTYAVGFWVHAVISYGFVFSGTALFGLEVIRSTGVRRRQALLLVVAVVPPVFANAMSILDVAFVPYDITPLGYMATALVLAWALYSGHFLDILPVARRTVMGELEDAVVTIDAGGRVVDCNAAARDLFGAGDGFVGTSLADFAGPVPSELVERVDATGGFETETSMRIDGAQRHYAVSATPVGNATRDGRVLVFRDVTQRTRREQDLDLLRQVLTRVLRHNIRNELSAINGNAELIARGAADPHRERAEAIIRASDDLEDLSRKARRVERIVERDEETVEYDLASLVDRSIDTVREAYPAVTYHPPDCDACPVQGSVGLEAAVLNLVENAAEHNDAADPTVQVCLEQSDGKTQLTVTDNGPGIPDEEVLVIEQHEETPLEHGSGLGLWLVNWVLESMDGDLSFQTGEVGTTVTIEFQHSRSV